MRFTHKECWVLTALLSPAIYVVMERNPVGFFGTLIGLMVLNWILREIIYRTKRKNEIIRCKRMKVDVNGNFPASPRYNGVLMYPD